MSDTTAAELGQALTVAAQLGIDAGAAGTAVDNTAQGIALSVLTERRLADRTTIYQYAVQLLQAEAAVEIVNAQLAESRKVDAILGLSSKPTNGVHVRSARVIDLGHDSYVVEIENALGREGQTLYDVIVEGKRTHALYETADLALLAYVGRAHSGMELSALVYGAARLLDAPTA